LSALPCRRYAAARAGGQARTLDWVAAAFFALLTAMPAATLAAKGSWHELGVHLAFNTMWCLPYLLLAALTLCFGAHQAVARYAPLRDTLLVAAEWLAKPLLCCLVLLGAGGLQYPADWELFSASGMDAVMLVGLKPLALQVGGACISWLPLSGWLHLLLLISPCCVRVRTA
jgi:hypothetical protein